MRGTPPRAREAGGPSMLQGGQNCATPRWPRARCGLRMSRSERRACSMLTIVLRRAAQPAPLRGGVAATSNPRQRAAHKPLYDIHPLTGISIEVFYADRTLETFGRCGAGWFWWSRRRRLSLHRSGRLQRATLRIGTR